MSYKSTKSEQKGSKTIRELGIITTIAILIFALIFVVKPFEGLAGWSQAYEKWEIDESLAALVILALAFGIYSLYRCRELRHEITEREKAERIQAHLLEEVKSAKRETENINKELMDFAYIVSHDLKAPLRGIKTVANWISADYADRLGEDGREQINLLSSQVDRMHNLIDGVLQYCKVGRDNEKKVQVNLNELVSEVIDMLAVPENIEVTIENKLPVVQCEKTRIMQVFQNLLSNAVKYMDKKQGQVRIGCVEEDGFWKFSVADNGPGIEEKHFKEIFQIFQTLSPCDKTKSTGIGLSVAKRIVEMYSCKIWVESEVGNGSTFFFTFPKTRDIVKTDRLVLTPSC